VAQVVPAEPWLLPALVQQHFEEAGQARQETFDNLELPHANCHRQVHARKRN
jgi:hypothetical protein